MIETFVLLVGGVGWIFFWGFGFGSLLDRWNRRPHPRCDYQGIDYAAELRRRGPLPPYRTWPEPECFDDLERQRVGK